jgi:putative membrane protein
VGLRTFCQDAGVLLRILFGWLSNIVALFVAAWIVSDVGYGDDFWVLFIAALIFTVVNMFVRPIVILLALPAVVLTLGLALVLINTFMLYLTDWIVPSFETGSFWSTLGAAIIVSIVNLIINLVLKPDERLDARAQPPRPQLPRY